MDLMENVSGNQCVDKIHLESFQWMIYFSVLLNIVKLMPYMFPRANF